MKKAKCIKREYKLLGEDGWCDTACPNKDCGVGSVTCINCKRNAHHAKKRQIVWCKPK